MATKTMTGYQEFDYWKSRWGKDDTVFLTPRAHRLLEKHQDLLLEGKVDAQVFIPMCGKAREIKWFHSKGHRVVGVEFVEAAARSFFSDNALPLEESVCDVLKCKILHTPDRRIRIFVCSVYEFKRECAGAMDIVWDKGGVTSIRVEDRDRYMSVMKSLLAPKFSYILVTVFYDDPSFKGYPFSMSDELIRSVFGSDMNLRKVDEDDDVPDKSTSFTKAALTETLWHIKG